MKCKTRKDALKMRHIRIRKKISGTKERPRMAIRLTSRHMYVQFIDDAQGVTLAAASSHGGEKTASNMAAAARLGESAAACAQKAGIAGVVVDRGGHRFHGKVKAIVDEMVKAGLVPGAKAEVEA
jgi:large subunit ribosomal protein L18